MKKFGRKFLAVLSLSLLLTGCGGEVAESNGQTGGVGGNAAPDLQKIGEAGRQVVLAGDEVEWNIRAQDDYYGYVNAQDLWNMSVPFGETTAGGIDGAFLIIDEQLNTMLKEILESKTDYPKGSTEQFIREYYQLMKDGKITNKSVFDQVFQMIDSATTVEDFTTVLARLSGEYGCDVLYNWSEKENPYDPSEYILCLGRAEIALNSLKEMKKEDSQINNFKQDLTEVLYGMGVPFEEAEKQAKAITLLWVDIMYATDIDSEEDQFAVIRNSQEYSLDKLSDLFPGSFDAREYLKAVGYEEKALEKTGRVYVQQPKQAEVIKSLLTTENLPLWKAYAKCCFVAGNESLAPEGYVLETADYSQVTMEDAMEEIKHTLYPQLSTLYYKTYYNEEMDRYMHRMEEDIKAAYVEMIASADWLSEEGRQGFIDKFNHIDFYFGGGEMLTGGIPMEAQDTLLDTTLFMLQETNKINRHRLLETPDYSRWKMGSQEVNAYYDPSANSIYVTCGILNDPMFSMDRDYYANLGAIGTIICHELSHGFDNEGICYDADGKYRPEWVSQADRDAFDKLVEKVDEHYDAYTLLDKYHVNGEKTVGENLADIGALQCVLSMAKTDAQCQAIFEAYAKVWCTLYQNENILLYLKNDLHSPAPVRVNAVLSCFDRFYKIYNVQEGDGMYLPVEKRLKRW